MQAGKVKDAGAAAVPGKAPESGGEQMSLFPENEAVGTPKGTHPTNWPGPPDEIPAGANPYKPQVAAQVPVLPKSGASVHGVIELGDGTVLARRRADADRHAGCRSHAPA